MDSPAADSLLRYENEGDVSAAVGGEELTVMELPEGVQFLDIKNLHGENNNENQQVIFQELEIDGIRLQGVQIQEFDESLANNMVELEGIQIEFDQNAHALQFNPDVDVTNNQIQYQSYDVEEYDFSQVNSQDMAKLGQFVDQITAEQYQGVQLEPGEIFWKVLDGNQNQFYNDDGRELEAPLDLYMDIYVPRKRLPGEPRQRKMKLLKIDKINRREAKVQEKLMKKNKVKLDKTIFEEDLNIGGDTTQVNTAQIERERAKLYKSLSNYPGETITWLLEHFEPLPDSLVPRSQIYFHYIQHCDEMKVPLVNCASFGKLIHNLFPDLKTRRLGTRGNSKYHYAGIRIKSTSRLLNLPWIHLSESASAVKNANKKWKETEMLNIVDFFAPPGSVNSDNFPDLASPTHELPNNLVFSDIVHFRDVYKALCGKMLDRISRFKTDEFHKLWIDFWITGLDIVEDSNTKEIKYFPLDKMESLVQIKEVQNFIQLADLHLYRSMLDILIPNPLKRIPASIKLRIASFIVPLDGRIHSELSKKYSMDFVNMKVSAVLILLDSIKLSQTLSHIVDYLANVFEDFEEVSRIHCFLSDLEEDNGGFSFTNTKNDSNKKNSHYGYGIDEMDYCPSLLKMLIGLVGIQRYVEDGIQYASKYAEELEEKYIGAIVQPLIEEVGKNPHVNLENEEIFEKTKRKIHQFLLGWTEFFVDITHQLNMESFDSSESFFYLSTFLEIYMEYLIEKRIFGLIQNGVTFISLQRKILLTKD